MAADRRQSVNVRGVCFLTHCYPSFHGHFAGRFIESLAHALGKSGYDVSIVTPRIFEKDRLVEAQGSVTVYRHRFWTANQYLKYYRRLPVFRMLTYVTTGVWTAYRVVRRRRCALIHAHWIIPSGFLALLLGRLTGLPFVVTARGSDVSVYPRKSRFLHTLAALVLRDAAGIMARSASLKAEMVKVFGLLEERIRVVRAGVDLSLFRPLDQPEARLRLGLPQGKDIVLFVGYLSPIKGVHHLIEALPEVVKANGNVLCSVVGDGDMRDRLLRRISELGVADHVHLFGEQPYETMPLWMNAADVLVVPSLSEGVPNVVVEALACRVPVIGTTVGDIPNLISHEENGLLIRPDDPGVIASSLIHLLAGDRAPLERMKRACAAQPPPATLEAEADQNIAVYEEVLRSA